MNADKLRSIRIEPADRQRKSNTIWFIYAGVAFFTLVAAFVAIPRKSDASRIVQTDGSKVEAKSVEKTKPTSSQAATTVTNAPVIAPATSPDAVLTVSGYIINRERIEISPRTLNMVKWISVKKGDRVEKGQQLVQLDDAEEQARLLQARGALDTARVAVEKAEIQFRRISELAKSRVASKDEFDQARLGLDSARAAQAQSQGSYDLAKTQLEFTVIRAPIRGVVLEKLADPGELVTPQSFGGSRGPSTALLALADPEDLQVEIDVNESDLGKIVLNQKCRVFPEAYPDREYPGRVAEISPEASRQKGTLQIKVQIEKPDAFLTPELSARVDFLSAQPEL